MERGGGVGKGGGLEKVKRKEEGGGMGVREVWGR